MNWVLVIGMLAGAAFLAFTGLRVGDRRLHVVLLRADLPAEPEVLRIFRAQLRARGIAGVIGSLAAAAICAALILVTASHTAGLETSSPRTTTPSMLPQLLAAIFLTCLTVAMSVPALAPFVRPGQDAPRYARLSVPRLNDYVTPWRVWSARVLVLAAVASVPVMLTHPTTPGFAVMGAAGAGTAVVVLVAVELLSRRMLAAPRHASSPLELLTDDGLRSWALCSLWAAPFALATLAVAAACASLSIGILYSVFVTAVSCAPAIILAGSLNARYRRRLWPDEFTEPGDHASPARYPDPGWRA